MCQYCGCDENTHIGRLMAEHDDLVNSVGDLRRAIEQEEHVLVERLCGQLTDSFNVHAEDEEEGIFFEMKEAQVATEKIQHLCDEHHALHAYIAAIAEGNYDQLPAFEHLMREHINAEDNGLFPAANIELDGPAWERIQATYDDALARRGTATL